MASAPRSQSSSFNKFLGRVLILVVLTVVLWSSMGSDGSGSSSVAQAPLVAPIPSQARSSKPVTTVTKGATVPPPVVNVAPAEKTAATPQGGVSTFDKFIGKVADANKQQQQTISDDEAPPVEISTRLPAPDPPSIVPLEQQLQEKKKTPKHPWGNTNMWHNHPPAQYASNVDPKNGFRYPLSMRANQVGHPDLCNDTQRFPHQVMVANPPLDVNIPTLEEMKSHVLMPEMYEHWRHLQYYTPPPHYNEYRKDPEKLKSVLPQGCETYRGALIGFGIYPSVVLAPFIKSFQRYGAGKCNKMFMFVKEVPQPGLAYYAKGEHGTTTDVFQFENFTAWEEKIRASGKQVKGVEMMRSAILSMWLEEKISTGPLDFTHMIQVDTRDAIFMDDPFKPLTEYRLFDRVVKRKDREEPPQTTVGSAEFMEKEHGYKFVAPDADELNPDFMFAVSEDELRFAEGFGVHINNRWVAGVAGWKYDHLLRGTATYVNPEDPTKPVSVRCLNSGIYGGTPLGVLNFLRLFADIQEFAAEGFGYDQGALDVVYFGAFYAARFPHLAVLLEPSRSAYRHQYWIGEGPKYVRWDADGRHRNCVNHRYAITHQLDRFAGAWRAVNKEYIDIVEDYCEINRLHGKTKVTEDVKKRKLLTSLQDPTVTKTETEMKALDDAASNFKGIKDIQFPSAASSSSDKKSWLHAEENAPSSKGQCLVKTAIVAIAVGVPLDELRALIQSFQRYGDASCEALFLIGNQPAHLIYNRSDEAPKFTFFPKLAVGIYDPARDKNNTNIFTAVKTLLKSRELNDYDFFIYTDPKSVFMNSPSAWFKKHRADIRDALKNQASPSFLTLTQEPWFIAAADPMIIQFMMNELFKSPKEDQFTYLAKQSSMPGVPLHSITPLVFTGTRQAIIDYLSVWEKLGELFNGQKNWFISHRVTSIFLGYIALPLMNFPHHVLLIDEARGPFHGLLPSQPMTDASIRRMPGEPWRHRNCEDDPYGIVVEVATVSKTEQEKLRGEYLKQFDI